jgi:predicted kinase
MSLNVLQSPPVERLDGDAATLSSRTIIFMNGPALTFKTTISRYLAQRLHIPVRANYNYGTAFTDGKLDDGKRVARYAPMFVDAGRVLASGRSVILDGNFGEPVRRAGLWKLAREFDARVIAIRTACDAPELIRERARRRAADPTAADHGVGYEDHLTTLNEVLTNPLEQDAEFWELGVEVVELHTGMQNLVSCDSRVGDDPRKIAELLQHSGLLEPATRKHQIRRSARDRPSAGLPKAPASRHNASIWLSIDASSDRPLVAIDEAEGKSRVGTRRSARVGGFPEMPPHPLCTRCTGTGVRPSDAQP